jgi:hypothetical protein
MVATITIRHRQTNQKNHLKTAKPSAAPIDYAVRIIHTVCGLAGSATWIDDIRADLRADKVQAPIRHRDTAVVFDWLIAALSYQGISDQAAYQYMEKHGRAAWRDIDQRLRSSPWPCPASARLSQKDCPLDQGWGLHDRHRHVGSQHFASHRHPASVQGEAPVRVGLLPTRRLLG